MAKLTPRTATDDASENWHNDTLLPSVNELYDKTQNLPTNGSFNPSNYANMQSNRGTQIVNSTTSTQFITAGIPTRSGTYLVSVRARSLVDNGMKYAESFTRAYGTQTSNTSITNNVGVSSITLSSLSIHASQSSIVVGYLTSTPQQLEIEVSWLKIN